MQLEEYFEFLSDDDIRIRGHRIGIDTVLWYYEDGYTPEEIVAHLPSLSLEEVYATITYYLRNQSKIQAYLTRLSTRQEKHYAAWKKDSSPLIERLRTHHITKQAQMFARVAKGEMHHVWI